MIWIKTKWGHIDNINNKATASIIILLTIITT